MIVVVKVIRVYIREERRGEGRGEDMATYLVRRAGQVGGLVRSVSLSAVVLGLRCATVCILPRSALLCEDV